MAMNSSPTADQIKRVPKVLLHDHLDGGLRPQTMIDHALASGYTKLPSYNPDELATWFVNACSSGTLELYLETFEHTISVMQTKEEIVKNWLPRYTGTPLEEFRPYILLTNFGNYVNYFFGNR